MADENNLNNPGETFADLNAAAEAHNAAVEGEGDDLGEGADDLDTAAAATADDDNAGNDEGDGDGDGADNADADDEGEGDGADEGDGDADADAAATAATAAAAAAAVVEDEAVMIIGDDDDDDTVQTKVQQIQSEYELPAPVQSLVDYERRQSQVYRTILEPIERVGTDTVVEIAHSLGEVYTTNFADNSNELVPNVKPIVKTLEKHLAHEMPFVLDEILGQPSRKYKAVPVLLEKLLDGYGSTPQEIINVHNYLKNKVNLPEPPRVTPTGIDAKLSGAWNRTKDIKKIEIESLLKEIDKLKPDADKNDYHAISELKTVQEKLAGEIDTLELIQKSITDDKEREVWRTAQDQRAKIEFFEKVAISYRTETVDLLDKFAKVLAPSLTFVATDMRLSMARNITTRVANSLSFFFDENFDVQDDPFADVYAKQLLEEGIKFDFKAARELLQEHFKVTRKILELERGSFPQLAKDQAQKEKNQLILRIKEQENEIVGQLGARYVASASKAITEKTTEILKKKQITRKAVTTGGGGAGARKKTETPALQDIDKEIADHNKKIDKAIMDGDLEGVQKTFV